MRDRLPLILSTTALIVVVLGSTPLGEAAYNAVVPKNSVGTEQLKNNAVTVSKIRIGAVTRDQLRGDAVDSGKVKNRSLKAIDFALGQIPAGPAGAKGDKGDKGGKGDTGPPGLSGYEVVSKSVTVNPADVFVSGTVDCPAGKKVFGAGYSTGGPYSAAGGPFPIHSFPNGTGTGWRFLLGRSAAAIWTETFYITCATVTVTP
jgi:hypothetical protein